MLENSGDELKARFGAPLRFLAHRTAEETVRNIVNEMKRDGSAGRAQATRKGYRVVEERIKMSSLVKKVKIKSEKTAEPSISKRR